MKKNLIYLLLLILPLVANPFSYSATELPKILFLSFSMALFFVYTLKKRETLKFDLVLIPLIIIFCMLIINTAFSIHPPTSFFGEYTDKRFQGFVLFSIYLLLFFAITRTVNKKDIEFVSYGLIIGACLSSVYAIFEYYNLIPLWLPSNPVKPAATFGNAVFFGAYVGAIIPLAVSLSFKKNLKAVINWLFVLSYIILIVGLMLSGTRSAWLGFIVAIILLLIFVVRTIASNPKTNQVNVKFIFVFVGFILISLILFSKPVFSRLSGTLSTSPGSSFSSRLMLWDGALHSINDRPLLGSGLDTFGLNYSKYRPSNWRSIDPFEYFTTRVHNQTLEMFSTVGMLGFLPFIWLTILVMLKAFSNQTEHLLINYGLLGTTITLFVFSSFEFLSTVTYTLLFSSLAMLVLLNFDNMKRLWPANGFFKIAVASVSIMLFFLTVKPFFADFYLKKALDKESTGNIAQSLYYYNQAEKLDSDEYYKLMHGQTLLKVFNNQGNVELLDKTVETLSRASTRNPLDWYISYDIGKTYLIAANKYGSKNYYNRAISYYLQAAKIDPNYPPTHNELGFAFMQLKNYKKAIEELNESITLDPWGIEAYQNLAAAYEKAGMKKQARDTIDRIPLIQK